MTDEVEDGLAAGTQTAVRLENGRRFRGRTPRLVRGFHPLAGVERPPVRPVLPDAAGSSQAVRRAMDREPQGKLRLTSVQ